MQRSIARVSVFPELPNPKMPTSLLASRPSPVIQEEIIRIVQMNLYLRDFVIGQGFPSVLRRQDDDDDDLDSRASRISLNSFSVNLSFVSPTS